jgi:hypothetical protein
MRHINLEPVLTPLRPSATHHTTRVYYRFKPPPKVLIKVGDGKKTKTEIEREKNCPSEVKVHRAVMSAESNVR